MEYWMASNETGHNGREETIQEVLDDPGSVVLFVGYPRWLLHFAASCCILFILVGIPGNLFTIIALFRTKKLRNATAIFIINLSISDLMFCCFNLPLATSTFWHSSWQHGPLLCRLFPLLRYGLVAVSLFTILAITINRYVMIGHPKIYRTLYKPKYLFPMVLSTWIIAFGVLIVTWLGNWGRFGLDTAIGSCSILPDANGRSPKEFLFVVAFLIPCVAIVVCYARIFYIVRKTTCKSRKPRKAASNDTVHISHERRSVSPRGQQDDQSASRSNCTAGVPYDKLPSKYLTTPNQHDNSRTQSETVIHGSISELQRSWDRCSSRTVEEDEEENGERIRNGDDNVREVKTFEVDDGARTCLELKLDDIPYVDERCDLDANGIEIFSNNDRSKIKESVDRASTSARKKLERMASRASFIVESTLWVQRLNSKVSTSSDNLGRSRSTSPERAATRKATFARRESRFKSMRRLRNKDAPPRMSNKDRKLLKMILVIFSSFLVCYLPITITKTFKDAIDWRGLNITGYILIYLTTCINPVVYVVMSSEYRSAYKNVLFCRNDAGTRQQAKKTFE